MTFTLNNVSTDDQRWMSMSTEWLPELEGGCSYIPKQDGFSWERIGIEGVGAVILQIQHVPSFLDDLPDDFKPPTQKNPTSGLPANVWVGGMMEDVWPEILDVRSKIRFLILESPYDPEKLQEALGAWRCSNCGRRGRTPRPKNCPHAAHLCGDAKILPQIHWVIDAGEVRFPVTQELVHAAGALYWPGETP